MRLDFTNFVISGPSTLTASLGKQTAGVAIGAGVAFSLRGNCFTDSFTVSGAPGVPELCGTLTGEHSKCILLSGLFLPMTLFKVKSNVNCSSFTVYFDADNECHDLSFNVGQAGIGVTAAATRSFNIKVCIFHISKKMQEIC